MRKRRKRDEREMKRCEERGRPIRRRRKRKRRKREDKKGG